MTPLKLTPAEHDILTEVATIGAGHAVGPISKMLDTRIDIKVPFLEIVQLEDVSALMGEARQEMTAVMVKIEGDATGTILLLMHPADAVQLVTAIAPGQETSALEEIGNILAGTSLGALADFLGLTLMQSIPGSATDMLRAMVNEITAGLGARVDSILVLGIDFTAVAKRLTGRLYFLFDPASTYKILKVSQAKTEGPHEPTN